jgi:hypothetical protein
MVVDVVIIALVVLIVAVFPAWPYSHNWGYSPSGGIGAIVFVLILLMLMNII